MTVKLIRNNTWFNQFKTIKIEGFVNILPHKCYLGLEVSSLKKLKEASN